MATFSKAVKFRIRLVFWKMKLKCLSRNSVSRSSSFHKAIRSVRLPSLSMKQAFASGSGTMVRFIIPSASRTVLFPIPDSPTIKTIVPRGISKRFISSTTLEVPEIKGCS